MGLFRVGTSKVSGGDRFGGSGESLGEITVPPVVTQDPYAELVLSLNPVAYWRLNDVEGGASDETAHGYDGAYSGSPTRQVAGIPQAGNNRGVRFDGVNDKIDVPFSAALNSSPFTWAGWVRADETAPGYRSPVTTRTSSPVRGWVLYQTPAGTWEVWVGTGSGWAVTTPAPAVEIGVLTFLAVTYDGTTARLYKDGSLAGSIATTYVPNPVNVYRIGAGDTDTAGGFYFSGLIDEVAHFGAALPAGTIADLALAGFGPPARVISQRRRGAVSVSAELWLADSNGTKLRRLDAFLTDGNSAKITHSVDKEPKTELSLSLSKKAGLVAFRDWIIPVLTIRWAGGLVEGPRDMGHFVVTPPPLTHTAADSLEAITGADGTYILKLATFKRGRSFAAGSTYWDGIMYVFGTLGIPASRISIPYSSKTIPKKVNFRPGQDKLGVVNQFLEALGYYSVTADLAGVYVSRPYTSLLEVEPASVYTADDVLSDPVKEDPDMTRFCNVAIVRRIQTGKPTIYAVAINDREDSPASTVKLGGGVIDADGDRVRVEVTRVIDDNEVPDIPTAQIIANKIRDEGGSYYRRFTFKVKPSVNLGFHDVVALNLSNPVGEVSAGTYYRQAWALGFTASTASIEQTIGRIQGYNV